MAQSKMEGKPYRDFWEAGYPVFPLNTATKDKHGGWVCECGNPKCEAFFKHPRAKNWQRTPLWDDEQMDTIEEAGFFDSGYGVLCKTLLVVDVDVRNGGEASYARLVEAIPEVAAAGLIVKSGRGDGGRHLYFRLDNPPAMMSHHDDYPGLDFKSSGFVVGPGSMHAAGNRYAIAYGSIDDIEAAPEALVAMLRKPERHRAEYDGRSVDVSHADIADMLNFIPNDGPDYQKFITIGMAVHHATGGTGFSVWNDWASRCSDNDPAKNDYWWHHFGRAANPVTLGTLVHHAEQGGWLMPVTFGDAVEPEPEDPTRDGLPFDIEGVSLTQPPGFAGKVVDWIDGNSRSPRRHISTGAALFALGAAYSLHYTAESRVSTHMLTFCIAGSRTGKESIENGAGDVMRAAGLADAIVGKIKSEQEIIRNLLRNQCAFHLVDEMGLELQKLQNAQKKGGTPYLEGVIGTIMSAYGKSDSVLPLTGDLKHQTQDDLRKRLAVLIRKRDENEGGPQFKKETVNVNGNLIEKEVENRDWLRIRQEIANVENALARTRDGLYRPILGVMGFSTPVTFDGLMDYTSGTNGFIGRALIFVEHETVPELRENWRYTPMPDAMRQTIMMLASGGYTRDPDARIEHYGDKTVIPTDKRADDMLIRAARWLRERALGEKGSSGLESLWLGAYELVEKVSLVLAVEEGVRTPEHVRWAFALVKHDVERKIRAIVSNDREKDSPLMALQARIINICGGEDGETLGVIVNRCRGKRREDIEKALAGLIAKGRIREEVAGRYGNTKRYLALD